MNGISSRLRVMVFLGLSLLTFFFFNVNAAFAHIPHDVVIDTKVSPNYAQDKTVYHIVEIGLNSWGNLFKSEDRGRSWKRIEEGLDNQYNLSSLAISAQSPENLFLSSFGDGVYRSKNSGETWDKVTQGLENLNIKKVLVSPNSSDFVLAIGKEQGLYQTKNEGKSWSSIIGNNQKITASAYFPHLENQILIGDSQGQLYLSKNLGENWQPLAHFKNSGMISDIKISPNFTSDHTFFIGTKKEGIFKTIDEGKTFTSINQGLTNLNIADLAISPNYKQDKTLIVSAWEDGLFQSNDGGTSWQKLNQGLKKVAQAMTWLSPHFPVISMSPDFSKDGTIFVAGFDGLFKSINGGKNWQDTNIALDRSKNIHKIAISPNYKNDKTLAVSTLHNSPYISHNQGKTWQSIDHGIQLDRLLKQHLLTNIISFDFSPNYRFDKTLFASSWGCLLKTTDGGKHWNKYWVPESLKADSYMAISPNFKNDQTIYLVTHQGKILRSTDGGENFTAIGDQGEEAIQGISIAISPNFAVDQTLYLVGFSGGIKQSVDGGKNWHSLHNNYALRKAIIKLAISPNYKNDKTIFAGTSLGLFISRDLGETWEQLDNEAYKKDSNVENIIISPNYQNDRTFLLNLKGQGLFKTMDDGQTFSRINKTLHGSIKFSRSYSVDQTIYGATDRELTKSTDGGLTWQPLQIDYKNYNWLSILYFIITNAIERKIVFTLLIALFSYFLWRLFKLTRKIRLPKSSHKVVLP
ncbi:hypothetical protein C7H19_03885 [Aphanothece hegewaldii CCALA 016]|uniref:Sortilin N-terminal domain-containing protein n=1 Tax=Aphanothece hegewaldii CCALA 016 TaxID=2107694 RepID=A0A2T1M1R3_9CHRO|nr:hypothetical protein [Aphanothece hegewaldii]PSF38656.1 hypothetical protein C7H19_03885 [Aphanothece hegewaldii CCALA 016]